MDLDRLNFKLNVKYNNEFNLLACDKVQIKKELKHAFSVQVEFRGNLNEPEFTEFKY